MGERIHPVTKTKKYHDGIDLQASANTKVFATHEGSIIHSGSADGYGNIIVIKDKNTNYLTLYAHLNSQSVKVGDPVTSGQKIGLSGVGGTGPHLHFEVIDGDVLFGNVKIADAIKSAGKSDPSTSLGINPIFGRKNPRSYLSVFPSFPLNVSTKGGTFQIQGDNRNNKFTQDPDDGLGDEFIEYLFDSANNGNKEIEVNRKKDGIISINNSTIHHKIFSSITSSSTGKEVRSVMIDKNTGDMAYCVKGDPVIRDEECKGDLLMDLKNKYSYKEFSNITDSISIKNFTSGTFGMGINNCKGEKIMEEDRNDEGHTGMWIEDAMISKDREAVYIYHKGGDIYSQRLGADGRKVGGGKELLSLVNTDTERKFKYHSVQSKNGEGYMLFFSDARRENKTVNTTNGWILGDYIADIKCKIFDNNDKLIKEFTVDQIKRKVFWDHAFDDLQWFELNSKSANDKIIVNYQSPIDVVIESSGQSSGIKNNLVTFDLNGNLIKKLDLGTWHSPIRRSPEIVDPAYETPNGNFNWNDTISILPNGNFAATNTTTTSIYNANGDLVKENVNKSISLPFVDLGDSKMMVIRHNNQQIQPYDVIFGQVFDYSGNKIGNEVQLSEIGMQPSGYATSATKLSDGKIVIAFDDVKSGKIYGKIFNADMTTYKECFQLNDYTRKLVSQVDSFENMPLYILPTDDGFISIWGNNDEQYVPHQRFSGILTKKFDNNGVSMDFACTDGNTILNVDGVADANITPGNTIALDDKTKNVKLIPPGWLIGENNPHKDEELLFDIVGYETDKKIIVKEVLDALKPKKRFLEQVDTQRVKIEQIDMNCVMTIDGRVKIILRNFDKANLVLNNIIGLPIIVPTPIVQPTTSTSSSQNNVTPVITNNPQVNIPVNTTPVVTPQVTIANPEPKVETPVVVSNPEPKVEIKSEPKQEIPTNNEEPKIITTEPEVKQNDTKNNSTIPNNTNYNFTTNTSLPNSTNGNWTNPPALPNKNNTKNDNGLSGGAIAGITVPIVGLVILVVLAIAYCYKTCGRKGNPKLDEIKKKVNEMVKNNPELRDFAKSKSLEKIDQKFIEKLRKDMSLDIADIKNVNMSYANKITRNVFGKDDVIFSEFNMKNIRKELGDYESEKLNKSYAGKVTSYKREGKFANSMMI